MDGKSAHAMLQSCGTLYHALLDGLHALGELCRAAWGMALGRSLGAPPCPGFQQAHARNACMPKHPGRHVITVTGLPLPVHHRITPSLKSCCCLHHDSL